MAVTFIPQSAEILHITPNALKLIEIAGRTCWKSEGAIGPGTATEFFKRLVKRGHNSVIEHAHITVRFITDRGITHELVRHRLASFSQESTRYVNYDKRGTVFIDAGFLLDNPHARIVWKHICTETAKAYSKMLEKGVSPQFARNVLPNSLKTEIVMTANLREWVTILKQRTSPAAHPQMRQLMEMFLSELRKKNPALFKCLVSALN